MNGVAIDRDPRGTGRWRVRWREGGRGSPQRTKTFADEGTARKFAREIGRVRALEQYGLRAGQKRTPVTLAAYFADWFAHRDLDQSTRTRYAELWRTHLGPALGHRTLHTITAPEVRALYARIGNRLNPRTGRPMVATARAVGALLQAMLRQAEEDGLLDRAPKVPLWGETLRGRRRRRNEARQRARLRLEDTLAVLREIEPRWRDFTALLALTGLRAGELRALRRCDVVWEGGQPVRLRVERSLDVRDTDPQAADEPKWGSVGEVTLLPPAAEILRRRLLDAPTDEGLVFTNLDGGPVNWSAFRRAFQRAVRRAGIARMEPRYLRHVFATLLLAFGEPVTYVASQTRHAQVRMVYETYGEVTERLDREEVYDRVRAALQAGIPQEPHLTVRQAAERLGLSVDRVYQLVKAGRLPSTTCDGLILIPAAALERAAART